MEQTKNNQVFKIFIALCVVISIFVIYFLLQRPIKLVLDVIDKDAQTLEFTYTKNEKNPEFQKLIDRKDDGSHVVLILLTDKLKVSKMTNYETLISNYNKCEDKNKCKVFVMDKDTYLKSAKKRKY